jgi:hypothetical protein
MVSIFSKRGKCRLYLNRFLGIKRWVKPKKQGEVRESLGGKAKIMFVFPKSEQEAYLLIQNCSLPQ